MDRALLSQVLKTDYNIRLSAARVLTHGGEKPVYDVTCDDGARWIVRALPLDADAYFRSSFVHSAVVLAYLEAYDYCAFG